jgi:Tol biopolymer transport system component
MLRSSGAENMNTIQMERIRMRHRYLSVFSVVLLSFSLIFCIATGTYGDTVPSEEYGQFLGSTKLEQEIIALREQYLNAGDALVNRKDYRSACITYQKLLDILFRKSVDSNLDVWMGAYGPLYKQADLRQKTARKLFEESRKSVLASACESRKKARLSSPAAIPAVRERRALKEKGDLSVDGTLIISTFNTQSPPINSNQIIGVYLAQSGQKIFDDTPIIDDRKNPQISRWKGVYIVTDPRWSPDGTRYAYCINGALCVSDDGSAKPALVSSIPDSETLEDRLIDWSPDSRKLLYSRNLKEGKTIYWNTLNGEKERKLITGDWAAFSSDSQRVAISRASKLTVINLKDGKSEQAGSGDECSFSPDDQTLLVLRKGKGTARGGDSLFARGLAGGRERELLTSAAPFLSKLNSPSLSSPVWLAKTLIAFNVSHQKDGKTKSDIWAYSLTSNKAAPLTADGSSTLAPWLQSPSRVLTQKELIILSR